MTTSRRVFVRNAALIVFVTILGFVTIWKTHEIKTVLRMQLPIDNNVKDGGDVPDADITTTPANFTAVILLTYMRSGSSLTGDILQQHEDAFYIFEPLRALATVQNNVMAIRFLNGTTRNHGTYNTTEVNFMTIFGWLTCRFELINIESLLDVNFLKYGLKSAEYVKCLGYGSGNFKKVLHNENLKKCLSEMEKACKASKVRIIKTIRTPMSFIDTVMTSIPQSKVVHLIRDPRATINSQSHRGKCGVRKSDTSDCANLLCSRIWQDTLIKKTLIRKFSPERIQTVLYEDIAKSPIKTSNRLYKFLGMEFTKRHQNYVFNITLGNKATGCTVCREPWQLGKDTRKNSSSHVDAWKTDLHPKYINVTQAQCKVMMRHYGYELLN